MLGVLASFLLARIGSSACAYGTDTPRQLIMSGEVVPINTKTYVTGIRSTPDGNSFCGGNLISPTHVLTASHCVIYDMRWVSVGSHYRNGSLDGKQIRVVSVMNHPNYSENVRFADDFLVLELERPSKFKPVKLAAPDDSDFKAGQWAVTMGWGADAEVNGTHSYKLQRVDLQLVSDEACAANATIDSSMVCAGGVLNHDSCFGDSGGPLILEGSGMTEDVLIGLVSWSKDDTCGRDGYPSVYSRISNARMWIDSITGGNGTCMAL
ncbi:Trypsin [Phytophthora infestans]|uniref:Trypsin n=1 Tax=Phytophthora infestans TaxID=4787 RepID=A0A8S9UUK1_PHYIN|nr:Trypsin [Phytophthora infestans]